MGQSLSDLLYPFNPNRREQVETLANQARSKVEELYTTCVTLSTTVHQLSEEFNVVPPFDEGKTYKENFNVATAIFGQWAIETEQLNNDKVTAGIRTLLDEVKNLTDGLPLSDHVNTTVEATSCVSFLSAKISDGIAAAMASRNAYLVIVPSVIVGAVGSALGIFGLFVLVALAILAIGVIDGAWERDELEAKKADLQRFYNPAPAVSELHQE